MGDEPFVEDDLRDPDWVAAYVAANGHNHLHALILFGQELGRVHTMLHLAGLDDTETHNDLVKKCMEVEEQKARAWAGLYN